GRPSKSRVLPSKEASVSMTGHGRACYGRRTAVGAAGGFALASIGNCGSATAGGADDLGRQALDPPALTGARETQPVVQAVVALLPELERFGDEAKAAPAAWHR